jgi:diadenylate cyclase
VTDLLAILTGLLQRAPVTWVDLLDIAIVSVVVYELLVLFKGTRAMQMAFSAASIVSLFFVSDYLGLETVNWLIRNIAPYVMFVVIVLFQADIRRALTHFGRGPFFRFIDRQQPTDDVVDELMVASSSLAARRIGALIVIEREIGLRNYIEGGIPLDAQVTYDLLGSIFQPGSPLHDGAVIVQGDRIAAAACFLPLSVHPKVSKDLGTRHRAALGITEENDAVAIVISEESGGISVAVGGNLERSLSPEHLRSRLQELIGVRRRRVRRRFRLGRPS